MKKLSQLTESVWGDIRKRADGQAERKENISASIVIDGEKYYFTTDFWGMGDTYKEENDKDWIAFAFNKMPNGSHTISGDTEVAGAFGVDKWDFDDEFDVYVLKDYMDYSSEELAQRSIDAFQLYNADFFIQQTLENYVKDVFKNHMSDYAKFWINELRDSDMDKSLVISVCEGTDYGEIDSIRDEFDEDITDARLFLYPALEGWYENLEKDLIAAHEKEGWTQSKTFEPDYTCGIPGGTLGLCFVRFDDE